MKSTLKKDRLPDRVKFHWHQVKKNGREFSVCKSIAFFAALAMGHYGVAMAAPSGGKITGGQGTISQNGPRTDINQDTERLDIDWQTFSTNANESVNFNQPSEIAVAINRVVGGVPSELRGALTANGRIFILNNSGITFYGTSKVNVGALVAATADRVDSNGNLISLSGGGNGAVINHGQIKVSNGGFAILAAPNVTNTGTIQADLGQIGLLGADGMVIDLRGDGLISYSLDKATAGNILNTGTLQARSGRIHLSVADAEDLVAGVINADGVIDASEFGADDDGGVVLIEGGDIAMSATVSADGVHGGQIDVLGDDIELTSARISASGPNGGGNIRIGGDYQGKGNVKNAETVSVDGGTIIRADATEAGDGGLIIVWSDGVTTVHGEITARGGQTSGDGGFIETSGKKELVFSRAADASAPNGAPGTWLLDPENIDIGGGEASAIEDSLNLGNNVSVKTGESGEGEGNISVNSSITKSEGGDAKLTLDAHGKIDVNASIKSESGKLDVKLKAGTAVNINSSIETNGGGVSTDITGVEVAEVEESEDDDDSSSEDQSDDDDNDDSSSESEDTESTELAEQENEPEEEEPLSEAEEAAQEEAIVEEAEEAADDVAEVAEAIEESEDEIAPVGETITPSFVLDGQIITGGGDVEINVIDGVANVDGVIDASNLGEGETGGNVGLFADEVNLGSNAVIDVSGAAGGGEALIGGDLQGGGDAPTATRTTVADGAIIRSDATDAGDGGKVIVWADDTTIFHGEITARGGPNGGDGGFVEVSGKQNLVFRGDVDATAPQGRRGTLLLDPDTILIRDGSGATVGTPSGSGGSTGTATITEDTLEGIGADVRLVADKRIILENLEDDILDMQYDLTLQVLGDGTSASDQGYIRFEDLSDTIRVTDGDGDGNAKLRLIAGGSGASTGAYGGSSDNHVNIEVGNLVASADYNGEHGEDRLASIYVNGGGNVSIANITAKAQVADEYDSASAEAYVSLWAGGDITVTDNILVQAVSNAVSGSDSDVDEEAYHGASAFLEIYAGSHSGGYVDLQGDVTVDARAIVQRNAATDEDDTLLGRDFDVLADARALAIINGIQGVNVDGDIEVTADAQVNNARRLFGDASAHAYLIVAAGSFFGSTHAGSSTAAIQIAGNINVEANASHETFSYGAGGADAISQAALLAEGDIQIGSSADGEDLTVSVSASAFSDDFGNSAQNVDGKSSAFAHLLADAGLHGNEGDLNIFADVSVSADAYQGSVDGLNYVLPDFSIFSEVEIDGSTDSYIGNGFTNGWTKAVAVAFLNAEDDVLVDGDIEVLADAGSYGELNGAREGVKSLLGGSSDFGHDFSDDDIYTMAYLSIRANNVDSGVSDAIRVTGDITASAEANYRGNLGAEADANAYVEILGDGDVNLLGDVKVNAVARTEGTGSTAFDEFTETHRDGNDANLQIGRLAGDAEADAELLIRSFSSDGSAQILGDIDVIADAEVINGGFDYLAIDYLDSGTRSYIILDSFDPADAEAFADVTIRAAYGITLGNSLDTDQEHINVIAKANSKGFFNDDAEADAYLGLRSGMAPGADINIFADTLISASANYSGAANDSASAGADFTALAMGDITIDGDITLSTKINATGTDPSASVDNLLFAGDSSEPYILPAEDADGPGFEQYLFIVAGIGSHGYLEINGDIDLSVDAKLINGAETADAETKAYLYAATGVTIDGDISAVAKATNTGSAYDDSGFFDIDEEAEARAEIDIRAGIADPITSSTHSSNAYISITGDIFAQAEGILKGQDRPGSSDVDVGDVNVSVYLAAAGDVTVGGDIDLIGKLTASTADTNAEYGLYDQDVHVSLDIHAGEHDSGDLTIGGHILVSGSATVVGGTNAYGGAHVDATAEAFLSAYGDVSVADDITVKAYLSAEEAEARVTSEIDSAHAIAELTILAGDYLGSETYLNGSVTVGGDVAVSADAHWTGFGSEVGVDAIADAEIRSYGDVSLKNVDVHADGSAKRTFALPGDDNEIFTIAELNVDAIHDPAGSSGNITIDGNIDISATGYLEGAADNDGYDDYIATIGFAMLDATKDVDVNGTITVLSDLKSEHHDSAFQVANLVLLAGDDDNSGSIDVSGDVDVQARGEMVADTGGSVDAYFSADAGLFAFASHDINFGGDITVKSDVFAANHTTNSQSAVALIDAGSGDLDTSELTVAGDISVSVLGEFVDSGDLNASDYISQFASASFEAANDVNLLGDVTVGADIEVVDIEEVHNNAYLYGFAGSHSSGNFNVAGIVNLFASADIDGVVAGATNQTVNNLASGYIGAANDIIISNGLRVKSDIEGDNLENASLDAAAVFYLAAGQHGSGSSQSGDVTVGNGISVLTSVDDAHRIRAQALLDIEAAPSHGAAFNDDITLFGDVIAQTTFRAPSSAGSSPSSALIIDDGSFRSYLHLDAGDDIVIFNDTPPQAITRAALVDSEGVETASYVFANCGVNTACAFPDGGSDFGAILVGEFSAYLSLSAHDDIILTDPPVDDDPEIVEVVDPIAPTGGGGVDLGFVPPGLVINPVIEIEIRDRVEEYLAQQAVGNPNFFDIFPPGITQGWAVDPVTGQVSFAQSGTFNSYFRGAYDAGLCNLLNCGPLVDLFTEAEAETEADRKKDDDLLSKLVLPPPTPSQSG